MSRHPDDPLVARLRAAGCVFAEDEAALLRADRTDPDVLEQRVRARESGVPLELVLGWAELAGVRVAVSPGVFVPRQRTRLLVDAAARLLAPGAVLLDLGCGTGAVAAALAHRVADLQVWAVDLDPAAVACARRNLPPDRVREGDLYAALPGHLRGRVDVVVANAPYVPSDRIALMPREARDHEHRLALDGGPDGLDVQRRVIAGVTPWLADRGHLLVETGAAQAGRTRALMRAAGLDVALVSDDDPDGPGGCVVTGSRPPTPAAADAPPGPATRG